MYITYTLINYNYFYLPFKHYYFLPVGSTVTFFYLLPMLMSHMPCVTYYSLSDLCLHLASLFSLHAIYLADILLLLKAKFELIIKN